MEKKLLNQGIPHASSSGASSSLHERKSKLPLPQQVRLASDALIVSHMLEVINDIEYRPDIVEQIDATKVDNVIHMVESLKAGENYLSQRKANLIQRPDSADTVSHIKESTSILISESSDIVINTLNSVKDWPNHREKLDPDSLKFTKHFLRAVYTGIVDRLEASEEINPGFILPR